MEYALRRYEKVIYLRNHNKVYPMPPRDEKELSKIVTQDPTSNVEADRIHAEFDRVMNTPSPNPRYGGMTPLEVTRALLRTGKKKIKPGD